LLTLFLLFTMHTLLNWRWSGLGLLALAAFAPPAPVTTLSGHLDHAPAADSVRLEYGPHRAATVLSPTGNFQLTLPGLTQPVQATFSYGDQHTFLWLSPGDHQHLTLDFLKFDETLRYSGRGAVASNYLAGDLYRFGFDLPGQVARPADHVTPATTPAAFRRAEDSFRQQRQAFLATYARAHALPSGFRRDRQQVIDLQWAGDLLFFTYQWRQNQPAAQKDTPLPASYFSFLRQLPLPQIAAHPTAATQSELAGLQYWYNTRWVPYGSSLPMDAAQARRLYAQATAELGPTPARDQAMYAFLEGQLAHNLLGVEAAYPVFRVQNRDSTLARQLRQHLAIRRQLEPGQLPPDFTLRDNTGREVSLRDLRGKVVYLDFWGTWCPPCMEELTTASPALKQQFAGRDVVFLFISVRDNEAQWQRVLADKQLLSANSVHLRTPDMALAERYHVLNFPSYFIIGRDGRMVQAYAPRPSAGAKTVAAIEVALNAPLPVGQAQR
jgi:peroxiredoxin